MLYSFPPDFGHEFYVPVGGAKFGLGVNRHSPNVPRSEYTIKFQYNRSFD